jgi:hypothetical protein
MGRVRTLRRWTRSLPPSSAPFEVLHHMREIRPHAQGLSRRVNHAQRELAPCAALLQQALHAHHQVRSNFTWWRAAVSRPILGTPSPRRRIRNERSVLGHDLGRPPRPFSLGDVLAGSACSKAAAHGEDRVGSILGSVGRVEPIGVQEVLAHSFDVLPLRDGRYHLSHGRAAQRDPNGAAADTSRSATGDPPRSDGRARPEISAPRKMSSGSSRGRAWIGTLPRPGRPTRAFRERCRRGVSPGPLVASPSGQTAARRPCLRRSIPARTPPWRRIRRGMNRRGQLRGLCADRPQGVKALRPRRHPLST